MKKLISLALTLAILASLAISVSAAYPNVVGTHGANASNANSVNDGVGSFDPASSEAKVDINVTVGDINHRYAVDVEFTDITLQIGGSNLTWDVNKLEYVTSGASGLEDANSTVTVKNYSDLPIFVNPKVTDNDNADFISVTTSVNAITEVAKATPASAIDAGDGAATQLPITISVTASTTWADVATYYTPKLTGNTTSITAATVTFRIASSAAAAEYPNP